ncbi:unnamed protein product, partial [Rotaria magnacalcarata]
AKATLAAAGNSNKSYINTSASNIINNNNNSDNDSHVETFDDD